MNREERDLAKSLSAMSAIVGAVMAVAALSHIVGSYTSLSYGLLTCGSLFVGIGLYTRRTVERHEAAEQVARRLEGRN